MTQFASRSSRLHSCVISFFSIYYLIFEWFESFSLSLRYSLDLSHKTTVKSPCSQEVIHWVLPPARQFATRLSTGEGLLRLPPSDYAYTCSTYFQWFPGWTLPLKAVGLPPTIPSSNKLDCNLLRHSKSPKPNCSTQSSRCAVAHIQMYPSRTLAAQNTRPAQDYRQFDGPLARSSG